MKSFVKPRSFEDTETSIVLSPPLAAKNEYALQLLQPETALEYELLHHPEFLNGLNWGIPRYGHPEGKVLIHVREVLENIENLALSAIEREKLRLIAFVHDTFKFKEDRSRPRDWSKHHGVLARKFLIAYSDDPVVLDIVELHDEAYYAWCNVHHQGSIHKKDLKLRALLQKLGAALPYYYYFFKCDTQTGDKNQAPLKWFEALLRQEFAFQI